MPDFSVQPNELRSTSNDLAEVSSQMKDVMSQLSANLAAQGSPWGGDNSGRAFRNGSNSNGYDAQQQWVDGSVDAKTQLLDQYSASLRTGADTLEQTDAV
jgi:uncharacterized protein YukE